MTRRGKALLPKVELHWTATNAAADELDRELSARLSQCVEEAIAALEMKPFKQRIHKNATRLARRVSRRNIFAGALLFGGFPQALELSDKDRDEVLTAVVEHLEHDYVEAEVGRNGYAMPKLIAALLFVNVEKTAPGAARYANGDWSQVETIMPIKPHALALVPWSNSAPFLHRRGNLRQFDQRMCDSHFLSSRAHSHPALPIQPMRARLRRSIRPALSAVKLSDQH